MSKRQYRSLPKTQPTRNTSQNRIKSNQSFYQLPTYHEVSDFTLQDSRMYTHNMKIDYGKLEEPDFLKECFSSKIVKAEEFFNQNQYIETERPPIIMRINPEINQSNQVTERIPPNSKKNISHNLTQQPINVNQNSKKLKGTKTNNKMKPKLKEVCAMGSSGKKQLHSRLIKSYVPGGTMQIRLINYPDTSQYHKICQSTNKKRYH